MFRYINMPTLVAFYLREFSLNKLRMPSNLYAFIFCLCLPFISTTFNRARLIALAIAECTNSADQICRVLSKITGATVSVTDRDDNVYVAYSGDDTARFPYSGVEESGSVPYSVTPNVADFTITLNGASATEVLEYLKLLVPFYVKTTVTFI